MHPPVYTSSKRNVKALISLLDHVVEPSTTFRYALNSDLEYCSLYIVMIPEAGVI